MPIRPIDVRRKEFRNSFRGYDANQVDDFLDAVADEFERAYTDNSRMREEISSLRERLQQFEALEGSIRAALVHAEQAADDLRRASSREAEDLRQSATREADLTIREAKARAHQMLADTSARVERIQESYEALQEAKRSFANDFRQLLRTYMDMMENMEIVSARKIEASLRERLDTESIVVAREAASYEAPTDTGVEEEATTVPPKEEPAVEADAATQRIEPGETAGETPQTEPQAEEPGQEPPSAAEEPSTLGHEPEAQQRAAAEERVAEQPSSPQESAAAEKPAAEEVEREEPSLAEERRSESFFEREESGPPSSPPSGEDQRDSRIFRASRFLRRRE